MKNKPTVTIGIPAYNEEANIGKLLENIFMQDMSSFQLKKVIVISDQSTDKTDQIVKDIKNKRVLLIRNKERVGLAVNQNMFLDLFTTDILVILQADILPADRYLLKNLINPIISDSMVGLVSGNLVAKQGKTLIEKILNFTVDMKRDIYEHMNIKDNLFMCRGPFRAFSKKFGKSFKWELTFAEDAYSYLMCIVKGYKFVYNPKAIALFKSPDNLNDHLKQSVRFFQANDKQQSYFPRELVDREYMIPQRLAIKYAFLYFLKNPIYFMLYIAILVYSNLLVFIGFKSGHVWAIAKSSKRL